ncbi:DNA alkylation repair protein [Candidatus Uhrbacteria bacterium]|nr:DNA alkylation repair protein [Candidatus Uhrbacteria bacterium]
MSRLAHLKKEILAKGSPAKAKASARFFKTGKGQYGEGDVFVGLTVPELRTITKNYRDAPLRELTLLLRCREHEFRLAALIILAEQFERAAEAEQKKIYEMYLANTKWINNWDLVDSSAPNIVGAYLHTRAKTPLFTLAKSPSLWERRIAMVATYAFIQKGEAETALRVAEILIHDTHDLMHKAVGWMLREVGKKSSLKAELQFLDTHAATMPRTALRYAIERLSPAQRAMYMKKALIRE